MFKRNGNYMNCSEVHDVEREGEKCLATLEGKV